MKNDWGQSACYRLFLRWHFRLWQRNLLICFYSMVDRIYIGHIPGIGTDALAGVE